MSDLVSGWAGYNAYQKISGTWTKQNTGLLPSAPYPFRNLTPTTDYTTDLGFTSVDNAGNETWPPTTYPDPGVVETANPTPATSPMSSTLTATIDGIMANCMAAEPGTSTGVCIGIDGPDGYYYQQYGTSVAVNDYFRIASQTKMFTGTAVLRCVDQGLISLDDHLSKYVSGVAYADPTIQQMLMMQSGIYDYEQNTQLALTFEFFPNASYTVAQIIALIEAGSAGATSEFTPGSQYCYTNSNHYMLALVVQAVDPAGRTIDQIIQQDILTPLGMVNSYFQTAIGTPESPYAVGYMDNYLLSIIGGVDVQDCSNQNPAFVWAAGAIISQVSDMMLWGKEMMNGTLLSPEMHALRMSTFTQQPASPPYGLNFEGPPTFGYGMAVIQIGSWFGHDGSWLGYDSCTMFEPVTETIITVYENFQTGAPHVLASLSTYWYEIASLLLPGSTNSPGYLSGEALSGTMASTLFKVNSSAVGNLLAAGEFTPFNEVNVPRTGQPIPPNASNLAVTLLGAGGRGGTGTSVYNEAGGAGGGGGGRVNKVIIPVDLLGDEYSVSLGTNGTDTIFTSGSITLIAHGGTAGAPGGSYGGSGAPGGVGGGWSATPSAINGVTVTGANGSNGGTSLWTASSPGNANANDAGPGGPGGRGSYGGLSGTEQPGAASSTVAAPGPGAPGGNAPTPASTGVAGPGHAGSSGGEGAAGGQYAAGGGGGYSDGNVYGQPGGAGATGLALLEWT